MGIRHCHDCNSFAVRRSRRTGGFEVLFLPLILLRPYRCRECRRRFYGFAFSKRRQRPSAKPGLAAVSAFRSAHGATALLALLCLPVLFGAAALDPPAGEHRRLSPLGGAGAEARDASGVTRGAALVGVSALGVPGVEESQLWAAREAVQASLNASRAIGGLAVSSSPGPQAAEREPLGALRATGEVYVNESRATGEMTLFTGDTVRTGADGAASLTVPGRGTLLILRQTQISFVATSQYFASLVRGSVGLRSLVDARNFQVQVGSYVVVPVVNEEAAVELERAADGSARVSCSLGSAGVFALEGPESVFLRPDEVATIMAEGTLRKAAPPSAPAPAPGPTPTAEKGGGRTGLIVLGVAGAGAAGAAAALAGRGGRASVSPATP